MPFPCSEVKQSEIALLFGIPVTKSDFLSRGSDSDFLAKYASEDGDSEGRESRRKAVWESEYRRWVAEPLSLAARCGADIGATVDIQATLASLDRCSASHRVVIIFSHWKGPDILNDDLLPGSTERIVERAADWDSALGRWLRQRLREEGIIDTPGPRRARWSLWGFAKRPRQTLRDILQAALDADVDDHDTDRGNVDQIIEHRQTRRTRRRDALDERFAGFLRPGNRLELFDGLHAKDAVEAVIAPAFDGVLDLTTCTSTILADYISGRRGARLRTVQFPAEQEPWWAALCVKATLQLLAVSDLTYLEARTRARHELEKAVTSVARKS